MDERTTGHGKSGIPTRTPHPFLCCFCFSIHRRLRCVFIMCVSSMLQVPVSVQSNANERELLRGISEISSVGGLSERASTVRIASSSNSLPSMHVAYMTLWSRVDDCAVQCGTTRCLSLYVVCSCVFFGGGLCVRHSAALR